MAELLITFISIIGIIDATINTADRILQTIDNYKNQQDELSDFSSKLKATTDTMRILKDYLKSRSTLDPTINKFIETNAKVVEILIKDSDNLIKKNNKLKYALVNKRKLVTLSQNLLDWTILIQAHVQVLQAIETAKSANTLEEILKTVSDIRKNKQLEELIDTLTAVPRSIDKLSEQINTIIEITKVRDMQTVDENDLQGAKITIHKTELKNYKTTQDQWQDTFKRGDTEEEVLVERIQQGKKQQRLDVRKLALVLHQLGPAQNILQFKGIVEDTAQTTLFVSCGTFKETLHDLASGDSQIPSPAERIKIAHGVACAFEFLHGAGVYHRKLRSVNIYIDINTMTPYLSGFTNARRFHDASMARNANLNHDSFFWEAPERVGDIVAEFTSKCEVYTFGILLLVIGYWSTLEESSLEEMVWKHLDDVEEKPRNQWNKEDYIKMKKNMVTNSKVVEGTQYEVLVQECIKGREKIIEAESGTASQKVGSPYADLVQACIKLKAHDRPVFRDIRFDLLQIFDELEEEN